jgi:hypothetical protein
MHLLLAIPEGSLMARPDLNPLNIGSIANGAAVELFDKSMKAISDNIADKSTDAEAVREITLTFKMKPDEERRRLIVTTSAKCKLAPVSAHKSTAYTGKGDDGEVYVFDADPRQDILFSAPDEETNLLPFNKEGAAQ